MMEVSAIRFDPRDCRICALSVPSLRFHWGFREKRKAAWWPGLCIPRSMLGTGKRFVYVLRSASNPDRHYVGVTSHVDNRLEWHNHGPCGHTLDHRPWSLVVVMELPTEQQALRFERYLKSGSGRAFAKRHLSSRQERG